MQASGERQERCCEDPDCGDVVLYRRTRCVKCGLLVCNWCIGHVHTRAATEWTSFATGKLMGTQD
jgi:hypothetical protein